MTARSMLASSRWPNGAPLREYAGGSTWVGRTGIRVDVATGSANNALEQIAKFLGFVGVQLDNKTATALARHPHQDSAAFLGDLHRSVPAPSPSRRPQQTSPCAHPRAL